MASSPNPARITDAWWWFMGELLYLSPGSINSGIYGLKAGYHSSRADNQRYWPGNYSIRAAADLDGPNDKAAAGDWTFPDAQAGRYATIVKFMDRVEAAFHARDKRLAGWREVLGQADADGYAEGFDFDGWYTRTPDSTHLWHIHFSEHRRFAGDYRNKRAMLSILYGQPYADWLREEASMAVIDQADWDAAKWRIEGVAAGRDAVQNGPTKGEPILINQRVSALTTAVTELKARPQVDPLAVATALAANGDFIEQLAISVAGRIPVPTGGPSAQDIAAAVLAVTGKPPTVAEVQEAARAGAEQAEDS